MKKLVFLANLGVSVGGKKTREMTLEGDFAVSYRGCSSSSFWLVSEPVARRALVEVSF